ncbi:hypothetical protein K435DRAFT_865426 [Dendrothele bispora CBS 962.96]|uniref:Uncharacterized protein n=1 Tax=Dendrothele bispora (strain CBS 962.96) TaxID=1314807 RepID=A0A4S8LJM4_DENBC|nr:hypothetical protein K435DRAFT_865426 [Dendrothele bispora CBS 962.96]
MKNPDYREKSGFFRCKLMAAIGGTKRTMGRILTLSFFRSYIHLIYIFPFFLHQRSESVVLPSMPYNVGCRNDVSSLKVSLPALPTQSQSRNDDGAEMYSTHYSEVSSPTLNCANFAVIEALEEQRRSELD